MKIQLFFFIIILIILVYCLFNKSAENFTNLTPQDLININNLSINANKIINSRVFPDSLNIMNNLYVAKNQTISGDLNTDNVNVNDSNINKNLFVNNDQTNTNNFSLNNLTNNGKLTTSKLKVNKIIMGSWTIFDSDQGLAFRSSYVKPSAFREPAAQHAVVINNNGDLMIAKYQFRTTPVVGKNYYQCCDESINVSADLYRDIF